MKHIIRDLGGNFSYDSFESSEVAIMLSSSRVESVMTYLQWIINKMSLKFERDQPQVSILMSE